MTPDADPPAPPRHDAFSALRESNYRAFVAGWLPASFGLQMQATALAWEIYERTGDPLALGIVGLARALPTVLLALPAGQIVDLLDRRRVLIATQWGFALAGALLATGSIAWQRGLLGDGWLPLWVMYGLVALTGCARVFNGPSRASLLPEIITGGAAGARFHNAIAWNTGVFQLAATLGPIAAGILIATTEAAWPVYAASALACAWFALMALRLRPHTPPRPPSPKPPGIWRSIRPSALLPGMLEGVRHIRRERTVLGAILLDMLAVLLGGATALLPIYAKDILEVGPTGLGALRAAPFVGALAVSLLLAHRPPFVRTGPALLWSVAGFGACTIVFGLSTSFWLSLAALVLLGACDGVSIVIRHVLVSVRTPDRLRGRVTAVNSVFIECSNEVGAFESGLVARFLGAVTSAVSGGIGTLIVVAAIAWWLPELRRLGRVSGDPPRG